MHSVKLILFPGFQMLAYVLATETLRLANKSAAKQLFTWQTLTATNAEVRASNGALTAPDSHDWVGAERPDLVLLCAGYHPLAHVTPRVRAYLRRARQAGGVIGGVDTGSIILAYLGLLDGYQAVLHHEAEAEFRARWPDIHVSGQIYRLDRDRLTAAGGTATADALLAWIARDVSLDIATATAIGMSHGMIRNSNEPQRQNLSKDPTLRQMDALMRADFSTKLSLSAIATALKVTPKQLRRRSLMGYGQTPAAYYLGLRLEEAYRLLVNTYAPISEIAYSTGFESLSGLSRAFKLRFKIAPRQMRQERSSLTGPMP